MRRSSRTILPWLAAVLAIYLVAPFVAGLAHVGMADWHSADWSGLGDACAVSLASASLASLLVAAGGIPLGYLLARRSGRFMALLGFVVQLPLALPPLASGILLLFLLGYTSPLGRLTGGALTDSFLGIVLAEAFVAAPFLIIAARSAFAALDPTLEDVAATLGHRPSTVFLRVSLKLAGRGILAGMLLAWLRAFGEFGATVMVAYHPYSLPVYTYVAFGSQGLPAMLPVLLPTLAAALGVMALAALLPARRTSRMPPSLPAHDDPPQDPVPAMMRAMMRASPASAGRPMAFTFRRALDGFDIDIAWHTSARRLAILGASGSGKSLTLRAIAGLDHCGDATLVLGDRTLTEDRPEQRGIAYVPQNYGLFPHLSVTQQLAFAVGSDPAVARHWIDRLGLSGHERKLPAALSLGQQQRVALGRAFSRPTRLLLLDEPFSALDAPLRMRLRRALRLLQEEIDMTTILVTHDAEEACFLADELLILDSGRVMQTGAVDAVFARPANEAVARLLGADTMASGRVVAADRLDIGCDVQIAVAGPALPPGARVGWTIRPERIRVGAEGDYPAAIIDAAPMSMGQHAVLLQVGDARLPASVEAGTYTGLGPCRVTMPAAAFQVWNLAKM